MLLNFWDIYSQHMFAVGKTCRNFHVNLKPKAGLKRQRPNKVHLNLKEKLEQVPTQLRDAEIN